MAKTMLIDASHLEETRVVVLAGKRLEEFDYETAARKQLKGNIYLAKITRVEPSLQAAFVEYGGNRHGFLPFSEIHTDYYRIPIADREALMAEEAAVQRAAQRDDENGQPDDGDAAETGAGESAREDSAGANSAGESAESVAEGGAADDKVQQLEVETRVDTLDGDEIEDDRRRRAKLLRRYKIQEVIKRRQVILVQVSKEERGTKGAALTTYLSLAGRYCVLMPNTARGGGISRKIGSAADRRRLKQILAELEIPDGMAVIVRTAGSQRSKAEIRRDYEYLLRLWDEIRETTLGSSAPCLIHEEANLIKRSVRDLYSREMDEVLVEGEEGYKTAKGFMRSLMPSHAKKVQHYKDPTVPLFHKFQVEGQLDAMHSSIVQLKSGGYIVMNQTEALVAIDVNSGKSTKERHIEETALKTNLEASDEVARQLRLRDLAGLVVVDFIDMEESRHNRDVERRLKEAMRTDRARIQLGRISPFGLLELSRQRLRPSLFESSTDLCPKCGGAGHVRSDSSSALSVLHGVEEEGLKGPRGEIRVEVPTAVAMYLLNELRVRLIEIEQRYGFRVTVAADDNLVAPGYRLERLTSEPAKDSKEEVERDVEDEAGRKRRRRPRRRKGEIEAGHEAAPEPGEEAKVPEALEPAAEDGDADAEERRKGRRRRGKRGGRRRARSKDEASAAAGEAPAEPAEADTAAEEPSGPPEGRERSRRPRRRRKAPAEPAASPEGGVDLAAASADQGEPDDQAAAPEPEETPRPSRGTNGQGSRGEGEDARPPSPSEVQAEAPLEAPPASPERPAIDVAPGAVGESPEQRTQTPSELPKVAAAHDDLEAEEDDPDRRKRRGWWQRFV